MNLWIVGRIDNSAHEWECCGVFDSVGLAVTHCSTEQHFVGPLNLNEYIESRQAWPGAWYPRLQEEPRSA